MSTAPLTLKYRPRTFGDVVGQGRTTAVLRAMVRQDRLPPALIFGGTRGTGKTTTARILAAALNCSHRNAETSDPCGRCARCEGVWRTNSTSVLEVDAASSGGVEDVRKIVDLILYSHGGECRVVLLDEAHSMSRDAFNALLKTLEEPPPGTAFVLLTTETRRIPDTIKSRSMSFEFRRITVEDIARRLGQVVAAEHLEVADDLILDVARQARGGMRDAVMLLDQVTSIGISKSADFREWFGIAESGCALAISAARGDVGAATGVAGEAVARTGDAGRLITEVTEALRDAIVLQTGGEPPCLPQQLEERRELASIAEGARIVEALRLCWNAGRRMRNEEDATLAAQVVAAILCEVLHPGSAERAPIPRSNGHTELTLSEMRAMVTATH